MLLSLYLFQVALGAVIHWFKPKSARRPIQNYAHAIIGLTIIGLAYLQVNNGYGYKWPLVTGRGPAPDAVGMIWLAWVVIIPVVYFAGLVLLPKQLKQESESKKAGMTAPSEDTMDMFLPRMSENVRR